MQTENQKVVRCTVDNGIALVTIDNPPMNALCVAVMDGLEACFRALQTDSDLRAVILTGAGRAFVAGADIKEFTGWTETTAGMFTEKGQRILMLIDNCPVPVIAAINGFAFGGGLELALACDMRLAAGTAKLGLPEVGLGIIPGYGGTQRLGRLVGSGWAKRIMFTADPLDAALAEKIGLVEQVTEPDDLLPEARRLAEKIASRAPVAVRSVKRAVNGGRDIPLEQGMYLELEMAVKCFSSADKAEGVDAFINKRQPVFMNK